jgi:putative nucleotidyltransferase with HDIG domain
VIVTEVPKLTRICLPLQTPRRQYGALWVEVSQEERYPDNLHTLANQAAIALERSILLVETRKQADELEVAYHTLETTYDQTLAALSLALDARDRETEGHSLRVARLSSALAHEFGLSAEQCKTLERGAILHDIGKIGISDSILLKPGPLDEDERQMMRQHPDIGARIVDGVPFLQDAMPVIRYHQECWNGSGYPIGLKGTDIPLIARIFAVVDTFDALTTNRPYRSPMPAEEAMEYICDNAGILYDPAIVKVFKKMLDNGMIMQLVNSHAV